ncbi:hypothetical protein KSC_057110 [Ktedonobacter sp. SOSP1-52]|nr:hypothetical protein KSC_057110 [Ktedonobacter sp. SOSP1-52]
MGSTNVSTGEICEVHAAFINYSPFMPPRENADFMEIKHYLTGCLGRIALL